VLSILARFADWFVPNKLLNLGSINLLTRARILIFVLSFTIVLAIGLYIYGTFLSHFSNAMLFAAGLFSVIVIVFSVISLNLFKFTGSFSLVGNIWAVGAYLSITSSTYYSGGFAESPVTPYLICLPILMYLITNTSWVIFWSIIVSVTSAVLLMVSEQGYVFPQLFSDSHRYSLFTTDCVIVVLIALSVWSCNRLILQDCED